MIINYNMKVPFFVHNIGKEEKALVFKALSEEFLTTGKYVQYFEKLLSIFLGVKYSLGVMSCTHALELALLALDVGEGDEVITTPMTFVATSLAILHVGATPVLVDVESSTGNIDVNLIENSITENTKAILPVHLYGQMCDMKKIRSIADKYNLFVIEDAAHALESARDGVLIGDLADAVCLSFYTTKAITSGEGGAVATNDRVLYKRMRSMRTHGMDKEVSKRHNTSVEWDLKYIGMKCNMSNIQAALLIPQMKYISANRDRREQVYEYYRTKLKDIDEIGYPEIKRRSIHAHHLFTIWVTPPFRDYLINFLMSKNIGTAINYKSINLLTAMQKKLGKDRGSFPISEEIGDKTLSLPLYPKLSFKKIDYVCNKIRQFFGK